MEWWEVLIVMAVVLPIAVLWLGCIIDEQGSKELACSFFTRPEVSDWGKAAWVLFILFASFNGGKPAVCARDSALPG